MTHPILLESLRPDAFPERWAALEVQGFRLGYRAWDGGCWRCVWVGTEVTQ